MTLARFGKVLLALGSVLAAATAHASQPVVTAALSANQTYDLQCRVVNAGTTETDVTIEIIGPLGVILASYGGLVPPGYTWSAVTTDGVGVGYCRVSGIAKSRARVTLCVRDTFGTCIAAVTASE